MRSTAVARGVVFQVAAKFSGLPLSIITLSVVTNYLGQGGYDVLAAAVVFAGAFEALTELGIGTIVVRRVAGRGEDLESLVAMNIGFSTIYALPLAAAVAGAGVFIYWGDPTAQAATAIIAAGLAATTVSNTFEPVFDVRVRYSSAASAEFLSYVITLGAALGIQHFDLGLLAMCVVQILPQCLRLGIQWWGASRLIRISWKPSFSGSMSLLREALPITIISIIGVAYWRADGLVLTALGGPGEIGAYYLALRIAFTLSQISKVFERSVLSTVNEAFAENRARFAEAIDRGYRFLILIGLPVAALGWALSDRIVALVGNEDFVPTTGPVLALFFVAVAMTFLSAIVSDGLIAADEGRYLTTMSTINLIINIVGNIILVPHLGAVACAIMLIVTETIGVAASQWRLRRWGVHAIPIGYVARLLPAAALALGAIELTYSLPLIVPLALGGIAYLGGAVLTGAIPPAMRNALLGALRPQSLDRMEADHADGVAAREADEFADAPTMVIPALWPRSMAGTLDAPTTELNAALLETMRMRALQTKYVDLEIRRP
ncbi:oligosaccharide flippase family protein [Actinomycetospora termitidis]|uniref:Oligosaccharide flippase family protein n=1 Tax=Actinomycetospora termitidis TaxID=3053470 RepID=A0ABT7M8X5_9PSEU|nr:oligosaccharide flippase family protein [Actinomycetospora sp. Odt1-22]MDL5157125.1 oligosaccharide flippase family protein [Actinomycetospora sp. Odt1-22]